MLLEKILEEDSSYAEELRGINSYHSDKHLFANGHATPNITHHLQHQHQQPHYHHTGSVNVTNI
jgi:hypothetical protein